MNFRILFFLAAFVVAAAFSAKAQQGQYLNVWGQPQIVSIYNNVDNRADWYGADFHKRTKLEYSGGAEYWYNFAKNFGWQTGILYSRQGDAYSGVLDSSDTWPPVEWESEITFEYLQVPILFRFASDFDEKEVLSLSISAGLQVGYLMSATAATSPSDVNYANYNLRDFYSKFDFSFATQAALNIFFNKNTALNFGLRMSRSLGNIENHDYPYPGELPLELHFPISSVKDEKPDVLGRPGAKNVITGAFIGMVFRLGDVEN